MDTDDGSSASASRPTAGRDMTGSPERALPGTISPTRTSAAWTSVVAAVVLLVVLILFIAENTQAAAINFLGAHGHAPTAVLLLVAATTGAALVATVGAARIRQLRHLARRRVATPDGDDTPPIDADGAARTA